MKYLILISMFLTGCSVPDCVETSKVVSVGGCNATGRCGVTLENGEITTVLFPVVGKNVCVGYKK